VSYNIKTKGIIVHTLYCAKKGETGMIHLNLEENQVQVLQEILESTVADLGYEIGNTPTYDYRQQLKERRTELTRILESLKESH
jgi:hypothetical protein